MGASLTEQRRVLEEGFRIVNSFSVGREWTVPQEEAPANYVPAAAVRRRGRALSGVTGRKGRVGGCLPFAVTVRGLPAQGWQRRSDWRAREGHRIPGGVVKCVEIRRNTEGEGSVLAGT